MGTRARCNRGVLLDAGRSHRFGPPPRRTSTRSHCPWTPSAGTRCVALLRARYFDADALEVWEALPQGTSLGAVLAASGLLGEPVGSPGCPTTVPIEAAGDGPPSMGPPPRWDDDSRNERLSLHARGGSAGSGSPATRGWGATSR